MYHKAITLNPVRDFHLEVNEDNYWNIVIKSFQSYLAQTFYIFRDDSRFVPANERRRYFVTTSRIGWAQAQNQPCILQTFHWQYMTLRIL